MQNHSFFIILLQADFVNRQYTDSKSRGHLRFDNEIIFVVTEQKKEE